ncbi:MAG: translocation/assembly module TamB domain-containing protein [Pyrinomonadaceae bacterium]
MRTTLGDLRSDLNGRINLTGFPGAMQGSADLRLGRGRIGGETFQEIAARANFAGSTVTLENLDARFDAGQLSANGTVDTNTQAFNLKASGKDIQLSIIEALAGAGAGALPRLTGAVNLTASAEGRITDPSSYQINFDAEGREVAINNRPAGVLTLTGRTENRKLTVTFVSGLLGQPQTIAAQVDFANSALPTTIESSLSNADLTPLFAALLPNAGVRITGRATGTLRAAGNLFAENADGEEVFSPTAGLRGVANFTELMVQVADTQLSSVSPLLVQFTPDEVVFERTQFTGPGTDVKIGGTAALSPAGKQNLTLNGRLNLRVLNGISPDIFVAGATDVAMRVSGTYAAPQLSGTAAVSGVSFSTIIEADRIVVNNINGRVKFTSNAAQVDTLVGPLGGGRVEIVSGGARLEGLRPVEYRAVLRARDVTFPLPQNITATADANVEIRGTEDGRLLDGTITLRRAEYTEDIDLADLVNRRREASLAQGAGGGTMGATTQLNLQVQGNDALVVRNNLADIVGSVNLRIRGNIEEPIISGRVSATRGTVIFRSDRYDLTRAFVDLPAQPGAEPIVNVQAESDISGYRVIVGLTGDLSRLQAIVRSEPALPQADVVSLITTGSLSRGEASLAQTGVGTATSLLADTIINAPVRRATDRLFGLNVFEIDPLLTGRGGASPTARLTVGRQINRNLSVTYSTDFSAKQNQVIALEYRLSDRLSFVAQYEQGSAESLRTRSNDFSFEIRFRKRF